jgi:hypothetical protein
MGSVFVLILMMWGSRGTPALTNVEFADKASCMAGGQSAKDAFRGGLSDAYYVCVPKRLAP